MPIRNFTVEAGGHRRLEALEAGSSQGVPILIHHGTPGCGALPTSAMAEAESRGWRLITFSRAGYGASTRAPGRNVAQVVEDAAAIMDWLGIDRFATWGLSGGGPHSLACAALMPQRVVAVSCLSGVAPYPADGLDWFAGMGEPNVQDFQRTISGDPAEVRAAIEQEAAEMRSASPEELLEQMSPLLSGEDATLMRSDAENFVHLSMTRGLAFSADGLFDDNLAFTRPWGFDPAQIRVPTQVWQGNQDLMVPFSHGAWLAERIPGAEPHLVPEYGHLTVVFRHLTEVHTWLAQWF
jgi:pimeloyl-ACP methyl ester carboxylesterase